LHSSQSHYRGHNPVLYQVLNKQVPCSSLPVPVHIWGSSTSTIQYQWSKYQYKYQ